jgi:endonuclease YncB( thermonuclease family)
MKNKSLVQPFKKVKNDERLYFFKSKIIDVVDGDTVKLKYINLGFGMALYDEDEEILLRINGIDSPEIHSENEKEKRAGLLVSEYVRSLVIDKVFVIKTVKDSVKSKEKFGRYLCEICLNENETLSNHLIEKGFVRSYSGAKKAIWSDTELDKIIADLSK